MADLTIRLELRLRPAALRWLLAALFLCASAGEVGSESVTLSTYYPAPSGVYQYLISTNQDFLARDAGSVNIGYLTAGNGKLNVNGSVGIGTQNPRSLLEVDGPVTIADGTQAAGRVLTSDANGTASWQDRHQFGGMFSYDNTQNPGTCVYNGMSFMNPYTGACNCPSGYTSYVIGEALYTNTSNHDIYIVACLK